MSLLTVARQTWITAGKVAGRRGLVTDAKDGFKYLVPTYARPDVIFTHGKDVYLYDSEGNEYLDFFSGIAVNALGYGNQKYVEAITSQAGKLVHLSNLFHSLPAVQLAEKLVHNSFADLVFFCNSGTEANEAAIKFSRKMGKTIDPSGAKSDILSFSSGFHGRTMGALSLTWNPTYQEPFAPLIPHTEQATFNTLEGLDQHINDSTCAVIVEPIQGEGGVTPAKKEFLQHIRHLCDKHQALLIFDEVQCGLGRTGNLWAHELFGIKPDIMTLAKPLANGLPIGAVLVTEKVGRNMKPGDHGSTFSGGPLVCAAANAVIDQILAKDFLPHVRATAAHLDECLRGLQAEFPAMVKELRGVGLIRGLEPTCPAGDIVTKARSKGLLVITAGGNTVRMLPPLTITEAHVDKAVGILGECLAEAQDAQPKSATA